MLVLLAWQAYHSAWPCPRVSLVGAMVAAQGQQHSSVQQVLEEVVEQAEQEVASQASSEDIQASLKAYAEASS